MAYQQKDREGNPIPGMVWRQTPGHGFLDISAQWLAKMPAALLEHAGAYYGGGSFEEDLEYCRVVLAFPDLFPEEWEENAHQAIRDYYPWIYEKWSGKKLGPEDSRGRAEELFYKKHADNFISISAFSGEDWNVPAGYIGILATRGGVRDYDTREERYFLIRRNGADLLDKHRWARVIDTETALPWNGPRA